MKNNEAHEILDADVDAPRRILAAVLALAVEDLSNKDDDIRLDAEQFFWGCNSKVSDSYLTMMNMDPQRFKKALKARMEAAAEV